MANGEKRKKREKRNLRDEEKTRKRDSKKRRQTRILTVLFAVAVIGVCVFVGYFILRGLDSAKSASQGKEKESAALQPVESEPPTLLEGYWWYDDQDRSSENDGRSFFCIQGDRYRSYALNEKGDAFVLQSEFKAEMRAGLLLLTKEGEDSPAVLRFTRSEDGKTLEICYRTPAGDTVLPVFQAGDPPALPMVEP